MLMFVEGISVCVYLLHPHRDLEKQKPPGFWQKLYIHNKTRNLKHYSVASSRLRSALALYSCILRDPGAHIVLTSFLKKANQNLLQQPAPAFLSRSGNQASVSFPRVTVGRTRESYFLNTHFPSAQPLTAGKSDVWTYQRREGDPQLQRFAGHGMIWQTLPQLTCGCEEV